MSASNLVTDERREMLDLMEQVGADAPTLCEGWTVNDLAAHLVVREHRPDSGPGLVLGGPFARWTEKVRLGAAQRSLDDLLATLRGGPPLWWRGPMWNANVSETFIHHEDVRRANGETEPRELGDELCDFLWGALGFSLRIAVRAVKGIRLELRSPDGRARGAGEGADTVVLTGEVGELVLWFSGRKEHAQVEISGPDAAVDVVRSADLGL